MNFNNKTALVTGAANGIGKAIAHQLGQLGAQLILVDRSEAVFQVAEQLKNDNVRVEAVICDLSNEDHIDHLWEDVKARYEKVDVLVNSAGIIKRQPISETSTFDFEKTMSINVMSVFQMSKHAVVLMTKHGGGKIINFGSLLSFLGGFHAVAYSSSKGAIAQLTKSFSNEYAKHNIQVNAVAPGYIETDMNTDLKADAKRSVEVSERIPAERWGTPEDVAKVVCFLASDLSDYVTGTIIPVDGGVLAR